MEVLLLGVHQPRPIPRPPSDYISRTTDRANAGPAALKLPPAHEVRPRIGRRVAGASGVQHARGQPTLIGQPITVGWFALRKLRSTTAGAKPTCAGHSRVCDGRISRFRRHSRISHPVGFALEKLRRTMPRRPPVTPRAARALTASRLQLRAHRPYEPKPRRRDSQLMGTREGPLARPVRSPDASGCVGRFAGPRSVGGSGWPRAVR